MSKVDQGRGRRAVAVGLTLTISAAAMSWWAGSRIQPPDQVAASVAPPPATAITAPVELRLLNDSIVLRGVVKALHEVDVSIEAEPPPGAAVSVVTEVAVHQGDEVREGMRLGDVSGRPMFVMQGRLPSYRDLGPGVSGKDVAQLQHALERLGYRIGDREGTFGESTTRAVSRFYRAQGYEPLLLPAEAGGSTPSPTALAPMASLAVRTAFGPLEALASVRSTVSSAIARLVSMDRVAAAVTHGEHATPAPSPSTCPSVSVAAPSRTSDPTAVPSDDTTPTATPTDCPTGSATPSESATQPPATGDPAEEPEEPPDPSPSGDDAGDAPATNDSDLQDAPGESGASSETAAPTLQVPTSELVFISQLPAVVSRVSATVGKRPTSPFATLVAGPLVIDAPLNAGERDSIRTGAPASVQPEFAVAPFAGTVTELIQSGSPAQQPGASTDEAVGSDDVSDTQGDVDAIPAADETIARVTADHPVDMTLLDQYVQVTIERHSTGIPVLAVPESALWAAADRSVYVTRVLPGDRREQIQVEAGFSAQGLVEIRNVAGRLEPGDEVLVGHTEGGGTVGTGG